MTRTARHLAVGFMITTLAGARGAAFAAGVDPAASDRVRTSNAAIAALIQHASERSNTFRDLIEAINASDGIVYIEEGRCAHGMRACFLTVTTAGPNRFLWVKVDTRGVDCDLMGLIGHELQHTLEVLGDPTVTNPIAMYFFYSQMSEERNGSPAFETAAAIKAGEAVRDEVRQNGHCTRAR